MKRKSPLCVCSLKGEAAAFPVCNMSFNPNHSAKEWKGKACGNRRANRTCCGHEEACHIAAAEVKP